jgi:hypothetical protein
MVLLSNRQLQAIMTELRDARAAHSALQEMVAAQHGRITTALEGRENTDREILRQINELHRRLSFDRRPLP